MKQHHVGIPDGFGRWVLSHRLLVVVLVAAVTALAGWAIFQVPIRTTILEGFMADQSKFLAYRERAEQFGGSSDDFIYVATHEGPQLFSAEKLDAIRGAAYEISQLPEVAEVVCLPNAPWLYERPKSFREMIGLRLTRSRIATGQELPDASRYEPPRLWPIYDEDKPYVDFQLLRTAAAADPYVHRVLVSEDGQSQAMVVKLQPDAKVEGVRQVTIRQDIERIMAEHGLGEQGVHTAGALITQGWMVGEAVRSMSILFPLGALVVSVLIQLVFGRLSLVMLTMLISGVAVVWAVGATAAVFGEITLLVAAAPLLVLVIATADTVHLASAYMAEVDAGADADEALRRTIRDVGGACILTSVTTGVGFLSLLVVPAATIRHVAMASAVGVAGALLLALTLVPILLSWMPIKARKERKRVGVVNRLADLMVNGCERLATRWPGTILALHVLLLVACVASATRIEADADWPRRFLPSHPHRQAIEFFSKELIGANTLEIYVSMDSQRLLKTDTLSALTRLERQIKELPEVESVLSLTGVLRSSAAVVDLPLIDGVPESDVQAEGLLELARQTPQAVDSLLLEDRSLSRMLVRVAPTRLFRMLDVTERIERLEGALPPGIRLEVSGMYPIMGRAATAIIDNQIRGFAICFFSVMTIVAVGLRSLRLSLLAVAPNLLPLLLLAGALGLLTSMVDTDALAIAVISFGLAVDDTIHFLHRYDIELSRDGCPRKAVKRTYHYTGQAIVRTTVILGIGLLPFAFSGYLSIQLLGTYLVLVLACAVLGDLLLLPALILKLEKQQPQAAEPPEAAASPARSGAEVQIGAS